MVRILVRGERLMPAQKGKSLFADPNIQKSWMNVRSNPVEDDAGARLPAGIDGGIAELRSITTTDTIQKGDHKGKPCFKASAILIEPKVHNGVPVAGLPTRIFIGVHEDKRRDGTVVTVEQKVDQIRNILGLLGLDTTGLSPSEVDAGIQALVDQRVNFGIRTWKGDPTPEFPNPRVNEVWQRSIPDFEANGEHAADQVQDDTSQVPDEPPGDEPTGEGMDYAALGAAADEGDEEAQAALRNAAIEAGWEEEAVDSVDTWTELAESLESGPSDEPADDQPADDVPFQPGKGEVYGVFLVDPKTKKKAKKPTEAEVVSVDLKNEMVTMKNLETGKLITNPATQAPVKYRWDELVQG